ncbi:ABC transporter ATP-binding protein [Thiolapillus sp.]
MTTLLHVDDLKVHFRIPGEGLFRPRHKTLRAVDGISFKLEAGETLGIVGESGCGKSTLARGILGLAPVTGGSIWLAGEELAHLSAEELRKRRQHMQIVFQDPLASLDPRMTVSEIIAEPLQVFEPKLGKKERKHKVQGIMERVGLLANQINRYPHEFSGGQCQRIGIARALVLKPKLLICDEPVSALDVSIQAQIINLLMDIQEDMQLSMLFIAHDLSVVKQISHRVMVMYLGKMVEATTRDELYRDPRHPYTRALIDAIPIPDPEIERNKKFNPLQGDLPSPLDPPSGCSFRTRCPVATELCATDAPAQREISEGHWVSCHFA